MKKGTKKLVKIITRTAHSHGQSIDKVLSQFVEMTYQYAVTGTYSRDYAYLVNEHTEFITCLMDSMKKRPYFDYFAELLVELGSFDKKFKAQCMTPPEIANALCEMLTSDKAISGKLGEISCGTGVLVLEALKSYVNSDNRSKRLEMCVNDLDNRLVKITVIQCLFNLIVNDNALLPDIHIRAYQNDIITEWTKNGFIIYDNDPNMIQEPYVRRFLEHKKSQEKLYRNFDRCMELERTF